MENGIPNLFYTVVKADGTYAGRERSSRARTFIIPHDAGFCQ